MQPPNNHKTIVHHLSFVKCQSTNLESASHPIHRPETGSIHKDVTIKEKEESTLSFRSNPISSSLREEDPLYPRPFTKGDLSFETEPFTRLV